MTDQTPQNWPALIAWLIARSPLILGGFLLVLYLIWIILGVIGGISLTDSLSPYRFFGRNCIELSEQSGRVFQIDQCRGTVTELPDA